MDQPFSRSVFEDHIHSPFELDRQDADPLVLELVEVADKTPSGFPGEQFSLLFKGTLDDYLPQQTYTLDHAQLGRLALFLVPVDERKDGYRYEAFFNLASLDDD